MPPLPNDASFLWQLAVSTAAGLTDPGKTASMHQFISEYRVGEMASQVQISVPVLPGSSSSEDSQPPRGRTMFTMLDPSLQLGSQLASMPPPPPPPPPPSTLTRFAQAGVGLAPIAPSPKRTVSLLPWELQSKMAQPPSKRARQADVPSSPIAAAAAGAAAAAPQPLSTADVVLANCLQVLQPVVTGLAKAVRARIEVGGSSENDSFVDIPLHVLQHSYCASVFFCRARCAPYR
jgi:hypothetical protein